MRVGVKVGYCEERDEQVVDGCVFQCSFLGFCERCSCCVGNDLDSVS